MCQINPHRPELIIFCPVFFLAFPDDVQTNIRIHTQTNTYAKCASVGRVSWLAHPALVDTILVQLSLFNRRIAAIASASLFFPHQYLLNVLLFIFGYRLLFALSDLDDDESGAAGKAITNCGMSPAHPSDIILVLMRLFCHFPETKLWNGAAERRAKRKRATEREPPD